jgi:hypothetical protein
MSANCLLVLAVTLAIAGTGVARAQSPGCQSTHQPYVEAGLVEGRMLVLNNGKGCDFAFKFGGTGWETSWKVDEAPKHGKLDASGGKLTYLPESGYAGTDKFLVTAFGVNAFAHSGPHRTRNGRFAVSVQVRTEP